MTHTISIRTISIFAAIISLLAIVLMTAYGNPAQGQNLPSVSFTETSIEVDEPDNSPYRINAILTVRLSQASSQTVTVQYRTEDFTAKTATRDYIATSGTLYFYPGTTERTISVTVLDDTTVEESFERFRIELFEPTNATLGSDSVSEVNIHDFDQSAPYNLIAPATVMEGQGTFTLAVETATTPIVEYRHSVTVFGINDTAQQDNEFVGFNEVLAFDVDHNRRTLEVMLIDDDMDEPDKSFIIQMVRHVGDHSKAPYGVSQLTVTILDDDPATPTNLEIIENRTDPDLDHVAILQWDYSDAEGYLLESRDGDSGRLELHSRRHILLKGTHRHQHGQHHQGRSNGRQLQLALPSQELQLRGVLLPSERPPATRTPTTAISSAQWTTKATTSHQQIPWDRLRYPQSTPPWRPTWQPTGLTIAAGAKHRDVQISWDEPPAGSNVTGFALYRKWNGHDDAPHLCLYWSTKPSEFITSYRDTLIAAYETAGNRNKYVYTVYPLNEAVPSTRRAPGGCDDYQPDNMFLSASVTATLAISTDIFENSDGDLEYLNPPAPNGLTLETRFRGYRSDISTIIARWEDVGNAPGYKVRWRETSETDWREQGRSRELEAQRQRLQRRNHPLHTQ